jgi:integrase/recombinase XerD
MTERNLRYVKGKGSRPGYYLSEITLNYRRVRRFAGHTKEEAKTYLAKLRIAAREGRLEELIQPKPAGDTFGEYARALLDSAEWKAKRSASRNEISLKNLNRAFKGVPLAEINAGLVRKYITERTEAGKSPATVNRELSLLKSILYAAEYDGLIASNPIRGRRVKKLEEANSREKTILAMNLTDDKLLKLIDGAAPHFKPILELALVTGMRKGEIFKMKWKDVDFRLGMIRVPAENSKTKRERFVPVDSNLVETLDSVERKGDYVFMNDWTGKRRKDIDEAFRAACERAEIPSGRSAGLVFHDLRHLAAYRLVKVTDIVTASKILGHASIQMTMRYVHPTEKDKRAAIEKAAENLFRGRQKDVNAENGPVQDAATDRPLVH